MWNKKYESEGGNDRDKLGTLMGRGVNGCWIVKKGEVMGTENRQGIARCKIEALQLEGLSGRNTTQG